MLVKKEVIISTVLILTLMFSFFSMSFVSYGADLYGNNASGQIPSNLPNRLMVGLFEDSYATWMKNSGVNWDARYRYLTKGWENNWGWSSTDGSFAYNYFKECEAINTVPVVQYYIMNAIDGGESSFYSTTTDAQTMYNYFSNYKLLMQRVKDFGKPVLVLLEADGFAFMENQTGNDPNAYCAIASSGVSELAGLPNTAAGWGMAFLQMRKSVGASNAILGIHISAWASGKDIVTSSVTDSIQPEVDKVYDFLSPLGLGSNQTGSTYDVLVGDPIDRDADYYRVQYGADSWWDASDSASTSSKSFNRYAEWLRLWNIKAQKRWVLWQIPLGNSNHQNVYNNGYGCEGYKDNKAEYFFGSNSTSHLSKFANSGVIALLFGAGAQGMSTYTNDYYTDGQLYMQSRAGAFLNAGGMQLYNGTDTQRTAFSQIEAESYNTQSGIQTESCSEGTLNVGYVNNGDYAVYNNVDFAGSTTSFQARVASATSGGKIEIRLDSLTGTLVGTCSVSGTGNWQTWTTSTCNVSGASGTHNLYLKFIGESGYLFNVNWFKFNSGINSGSYYKLVNVNSGKVLGVDQMKTTDGARAIQWTDNGTSDHNWKLEQLSDGYYKITNQYSGKVLCVDQMRTTDGADILQWTDNGTADHEWKFEYSGSGKYRITNKNSGKVLDVCDSSTSDGGNIIQWTDNSQNNQRWTLVKVN